MNSATIVQKLWNYCNVLRDDGMSYGDYPSASLRAGSEQLTYLLFLKMADERGRPPYNQASPVQPSHDWPSRPVASRSAGRMPFLRFSILEMRMRATV